MSRRTFSGHFAACLALLALPIAATGQATSPGLDVRAIAEVRTRAPQDGREAVHLAPADRVTPGDEVEYTLEVRNSTALSLRTPTVVYAVPSHMKLIAGSATGPGAEISFSNDGGHRFWRASAHLDLDECTHVRWELQKTLQANAVAFLRFRAVVK